MKKDFFRLNEWTLIRMNAWSTNFTVFRKEVFHLKRCSHRKTAISILLLFFFLSLFPSVYSHADTYRSFFEIYSPTWVEHKSQELRNSSPESILTELYSYVLNAPSSLNMIQSAETTVQTALLYVEMETGLSISELIDLDFCVVKSPLQSETIDLLIGYCDSITEDKYNEGSRTRSDTLGISYATNYGEWLIRLSPETYTIVETGHVYPVSKIDRESSWRLFGVSRLNSSHNEFFLTLIKELMNVGQLKKEGNISHSEAFDREHQLLLAFGANPEVYEHDFENYSVITDNLIDVIDPKFVEILEVNPIGNKRVYFSPDHSYCSIYCFGQNDMITDYYFLDLGTSSFSHVSYSLQMDGQE